MTTASRQSGLFALLSVQLSIGLGLFAFVPAVFAGEFIELTIPLEEGRFYSPREFCAASNEKLGTHYILDQIPDRSIELTAVERAALVLANETGLLQVSVTPDRLVISVPNHEDDRVRRRRRERLEKLLHVPLTEWPEEKGLHLPDDFAAGRRTMLLVHGLEADASDLQRFAEACRGSDVQVLFFDYPNDGPIAWSGDRLRTELNELSARHPKLRLAIVAHSMGGLVARHALEAAEPPPPAVTHLFMLGTPNHGSRLAGAQSIIELLLSIPQGRLLGNELMRDGLGEAAKDLQPESAFLNRLNARKPAAGVCYCVAIGRRSFLPQERISAIKNESISFFRRHGTAPEVQRAVVEFLSSDEMRDGLGDGAVTVASAALPGASASRVFDLNHIQLMRLPGDPPEESEPFRWILESLGWKATEP
ncbi:MAG TPA: alpha/beta fold hydrolase [Pirellulales bacterium]|nr:alpha/beta fold hydrolase [Pirellulales bacterium]